MGVELTCLVFLDSGVTLTSGMSGVDAMVVLSSPSKNSDPSNATRVEFSLPGGGEVSSVGGSLGGSADGCVVFKYLVIMGRGLWKWFVNFDQYSEMLAGATKLGMEIARMHIRATT